LLYTIPSAGRRRLPSSKQSKVTTAVALRESLVALIMIEGFGEEKKTSAFYTRRRKTYGKAGGFLCP
jgi:hypothetical protein